MVKNSDKLFQRYVNNIFFNDEVYARIPNDDPELGEPEMSLSEIKGSLYVTIGDEVPWLVVYWDNNKNGIALEPEVALYWLKKITKYYETHSCKETTNEGTNE